jgi:hypothetical protein
VGEPQDNDEDPGPFSLTPGELGPGLDPRGHHPRPGRRMRTLEVLEKLPPEDRVRCVLIPALSERLWASGLGEWGVRNYIGIMAFVRLAIQASGFIRAHAGMAVAELHDTIGADADAIVEGLKTNQEARSRVERLQDEARRGVIIGGGQTGADIAGWRAAKRCGFVTRGWMPEGWLTEDGPRPEYAAQYGAVELVGGGYPERTTRNVQDADAVLWFGSTWTAGAKATLNAARRYSKPVFIVGDLAEADPQTVAAWIGDKGPAVLMIAGNRASKATIPDDQIERHLAEVFALLGFPPTEGPGD